MNDRPEQCGLKFLFWLQECKSQAEHREGILKPFPDFDWEVNFLAHVSTLQNSEPSDTFVKSHKLLEGNMSEQKRKLIFFGSKVKTAFETARRLTSVAANLLWIAPEKLLSGCNMSGMLLSIRKRLWIYRACELAKAAPRQEFKRDNKTFKEGDNKEAILARALSYEFVDSYFPSWLATFCYLGLPAGDKCRKHFQSGKAVCSTDLGEIRSLSHRANRRTAFDLSISSPTKSLTPSSVDSSDIPSAKRRAYDIVVTCQHVEPFRDDLSCMIEAIKGQVQTVSKLIHSPTK